MYQFGELLTLGLSLLVGVYLLVHRRLVAGHPLLRAMVLPFLCLLVASVATVVETIPATGLGGQIIFWEASAEVVRQGGWVSEVLNLFEHFGWVSFAAVLLFVILRHGRTRAKTHS